MKRRLLLHVVFVSFAYYLSNGLYMVRGLVLARWLGPAAFGAWTAMRMVQSLGILAPLGTRQGLVQLAPRAEGAGEHEEAARLTGTAFGLALLTAAPFTLLIAAGGLASSRWRMHWIVFSLVVFFIQIFYFFHAFARAKLRFTLASGGEILIAALTTVVGLGAAWWYGLMGFLLVLGAANVVTLVMMWRIGPACPRPKIDRDAARRLIATGFPLMASGALFTILWNVDKMLLWVLRGSESLGVYAVQASFTTVALLAPAAIGTVLQPHLMRRLGQARTPQAVRPYLLHGGELLAAWSAPICGLGCVVLHLPIRWWLPKYLPAIEPGRILMIASYFSMVATVSMVVVAALDGQRRLCVIRIVAIAVAVVAGIVGLQQEYVGLALAMGLALLVDSVWTQLEAVRRSGLPRREAAVLTARLVGPFLLLLASTWLAWQLFRQPVSTWQADVLVTTKRAAIIVLPTAAWAMWRSGRLRLLR